VGRTFLPLGCIAGGLKSESVSSGSYFSVGIGWLNMLSIEFKPSLAACIETLAKREYEESLRNCLLLPESKEELQEKIKLLQLFLESANFSRLRAECEERLSEGKCVRVSLNLVDGEPVTKLIVE